MCKIRAANRRRTNYIKNKDREHSKHKEYVLQNLEKIKTYQKEYRQLNKVRRSQLDVERKATDVQYRLGCNLRSRLTRFVRGKYKVSAVRNLGCTLDELKTHLAAKFQPGMSWENYGQWHIDHIIPLVSFDLPNEEEAKRACHYTNLQPLWAFDNISKGGRIAS